MEEKWRELEMTRLSNHSQQVGCFPQFFSQQLQAQLQTHSHLQLAQAQLLHLSQDLLVLLQEQEQGIVLLLLLLLVFLLFGRRNSGGGGREGQKGGARVSGVVTRGKAGRKRGLGSRPERKTPFLDASRRPGCFKSWPDTSRGRASEREDVD